jgi:hypothetical protein
MKLETVRACVFAEHALSRIEIKEERHGRLGPETKEVSYQKTNIVRAPPPPSTDPIV